MTVTEAPQQGGQHEKKPATRNGNFYALRQSGILSIGDTVRFGPGSIPKSIFTDTDRRPTRTDKGKVRHAYDQVKGLLGIDSIAQIPDLLTDKDAQQQARLNAYELIGNMYGIGKKPNREETEKERKIRLERIKEQVEDYAQVANGVVDHMRDVLSTSPVSLKTTNRVKDTYDPVDLLLMTFDDRYPKKARFEAKRKLVLMNLAAKIDQREREINIDKRYRKMNNFLDNYVFDTGGKIGETQNVTIVSTHEAQNFATMSVNTISPPEALVIELQPREKITPLQQRTFIYKGQEVHAQIDTRKKDPVSKVIKILRKGKESPAEAMGDDVGFIAVFKDKRDIAMFKKHLNDSGKRDKTLLDIQDVENSLDGSAHTPKSAGSSPKLRQDKSVITLNGITIEAICHTYDSFTDYLYQREVGHDEFEARRAFDSEIVGLLFPSDIYPYDEDKLRTSTINDIRQKIETRI